MYGNQTKQNILVAYTQWQNDNVEKYKAGFLLEYDELYNLTNKLRSTKKHNFNKNILSLEYDKYLEIWRDKLPQMSVILRAEGRAAALGDLFKRENRKILWKGTVDIIMAFATIATALIAFFALKKDSDSKIEVLKSQVSQIQMQLQQVEQSRTAQGSLLRQSIDSLKMPIQDSTDLTKP